MDANQSINQLNIRFVSFTFEKHTYETHLPTYLPVLGTHPPKGRGERDLSIYTRSNLI